MPSPAIGALPVPPTVTVCWLPATLLLLSVMVNVADRLPVPAGANFTLIVHVPPLAATELPHVFVWLKSPGFVPVNAMLLIVNARFPLFVSVTVWAALVDPTF